MSNDTKQQLFTPNIIKYNYRGQISIELLRYNFNVIKLIMSPSIWET